MKARRALLLSNDYSISRRSLFDISQKKQSSQEIRKRRNLLEAIKQGSSESNLITDLHQLAKLFSNNQSLLNGPLRHLKVEPYYREPTSRLLRSRQEYRKTSKIRLTGNWMEKAGFILTNGFG